MNVGKCKSLGLTDLRCSIKGRPQVEQTQKNPLETSFYPKEVCLEEFEACDASWVTMAATYSRLSSGPDNGMTPPPPTKGQAERKACLILGTKSVYLSLSCLAEDILLSKKLRHKEKQEKQCTFEARELTEPYS